MKIDKKPLKEWVKEQKTGFSKGPLVQSKRGEDLFFPASVNPLFGRAYRAESKVLSSSFAIAGKS